MPKNISYYRNIILEFARSSSSCFTKIYTSTPVLIVEFTFLFLGIVIFPLVSADQTHDRSCAIAFDYFSVHKFQFGSDVIMNMGPYGYLHFSRCYTGMHFLEKCIFGVAFAVFLSWMTLETARRFKSSGMRLTWLLIFSLTPLQIGNLLWAMGEPFDYKCEFFILATSFYLFERAFRPIRIFPDFILLVFLSLLALTKGTYLVLILFMGGLVVLLNAVRGRWLLALSDLSIFWSSFLLLWVLAGQKLSNLRHFFESLFQFISGYDEAFMLVNDAEKLQMKLGIAALSLPLLLLLWLFIKSLGRRIILGLFLIFIGGFEFLLWKHSLVRGARESLFWYMAIIGLPPIIAAAYTIFRLDGPANAREAPGMTWLQYVSVVIISLCLGVPQLTACLGNRTNLAQQFIENCGILFKWKNHIASLDDTLSKNRTSLLLPNIARQVGSDTVDQFGTEPGWIYFNNLNYHPRPSPITFATFNKKLIGLNGSFYGDPSTAPSYVLARFYQFEDRFSPLDDAAALFEITKHYTPIMVENGHLLLKRNSQPLPPLVFNPIETVHPKLGEFVKVPITDKQRLWCKAEVKYSLLGRVRSLLCKPAPLYIQLESFKGEVISARFLVCAGDSGFSLNPLLYDTGTLLESYSQNSESRILRPYRVRLVTRAEDTRYFLPDISIVFSLANSL